MNVDPIAQAVEGVSFRQLRDFLRSRDEHILPSDLAEAFGTANVANPRLIESLVAEGYLDEIDAEGWHPVGQKGMQLANAKFIKRMSRAQAKDLLGGLLERSRQINQRPELTHYIEEVHVFGSYLGDQPDLGDLDLAIKLKHKGGDGKDPVQRSKERALASGRNLSFFQVLCFGEQEVMQLLKGRKGRISLHSMDDLKLPGVNSDLVFSRITEAVDG